MFCTMQHSARFRADTARRWTSASCVAVARVFLRSPSFRKIRPLPHRELEVPAHKCRVRVPGKNPASRFCCAPTCFLQRSSLLTGLSRCLAGPFPEDLRISQRITAEPVCAVYSSCNLSAGKEPGQGGLPVGSDPEAAHDVVGRGGDFHRGGADIDTEPEELFEHYRKAGLDLLPGEMGYIEPDPAMCGSRPCRISVAIARATTSRVESSIRAGS